METSTAGHGIHVEKGALLLRHSSFPGLGGSIKWSKKQIAMLEMLFFSLHTVETSF